MKLNPNLREDASFIISSILKSINPEKLIRERLTLELLQEINGYKRVLVFGAGKASSLMAIALEKMLGEKVAGGILVVPDGYKLPTGVISIKEASHPIPDKRGLQAAQEIRKAVIDSQEDDLLIFLFSGGGSALLPLPFPPLTLRDLQETTKELLKAGANIKEINTVRKHISLLQGGRLAQMVRGHSLTFLLSDVVGDDPGTIASGPTIPDLSTFQQAEEVLKKYNIFEKLSSTLKNFLEDGKKGTIPETPKELPSTHKHILIGSNIIPLQEASKTASSLGYKTLILSGLLEGEASLVGKILVIIGKEIKRSGNPLEPPACLLIAGETTVNVKGKGKGGRNQEVVLGAGAELASDSGILIASFSTDGKDGPTNSAGAMVDSGIMENAAKIKLDTRKHLEENNSFNFFLRAGGLLITGPTYTNVGDIMVILVGD